MKSATILVILSILFIETVIASNSFEGALNRNLGAEDLPKTYDSGDHEGEGDNQNEKAKPFQLIALIIAICVVCGAVGLGHGICFYSTKFTKRHIIVSAILCFISGATVVGLFAILIYCHCHCYEKKNRVMTKNQIVRQANRKNGNAVPAQAITHIGSQELSSDFSEGIQQKQFE